MKLKRVFSKHNQSFLMTIIMLLGIFGESTSQVVTASSGKVTADGEMVEYAQPEEVYVLSSMDIVNRFDTTEIFVQEQQEEGLSLNDIYNIFFQAEKLNISYQESRAQLYPSEVNVSPVVTSEVYSDLSVSPFRKLPKLSADTVTEVVYSEEQMLKRQTVTKEVYSKKNSFLRSSAVQENPVLEKPPVYNKNSFNEAPYSIGINNESISSLSGGLSLHSDEFSLPGRNGLSFTLTRQYDTHSAQFYDMEYGSTPFSYVYYLWGLSYDILVKPVITKYDVFMRETVKTEYDYNQDGLTDYVSNSTEMQERVVGTYSTEAEARQLVNQIPGWTYTVSADSIYKTGSVSSTSNTFNSYIMYNQNGYTGTLYKTGSSYQSGGAYTPAQYKTASGSCQNNISGLYTKGVWSATGSGTACPTSYSYSDGEGYSGSLPRTGTQTLKECPSPASTSTNGVCTKQYLATYSGTATKPASADTRQYTQNYDGFVVKPAYTSPDRYEGWQLSGNTRTRKIYSRFGTAWVATREVEETGSLVRDSIGGIDTYNEALSIKEMMNSSAGSLIENVTDNGTVIGKIYLASTPNVEILTYAAGSQTGLQYYNKTSKPLEEKLYPIGKGWSWKLPVVEHKDGKTYVHLAEGGSYEVENSTLKGYEWEGVSFGSNTSVTVNGENSQYILTSADGTQKQYFTSDGRLIQISDAYDNSIQFQYENNAVYGTKLLSQVKDAIGNTIRISYTASEVILKKGSQTVVYSKHTQEGVELLDHVTDALGRKTTYSYQIKGAEFNLFADYGERATSNPYALLSKVQLPTGAATEYTYELYPVKRFIGSSSFNEAYRLSSRKDLITYDNGKTKEFNRQSVYYNNSDLGAVGNQDLQFSTTINDGLTDMTFKYKKDYINEQIPEQFYLESYVQSAGGLSKTTAYTYGEFVGNRTYPASVASMVSTSNSANSDVLTLSNKYDDYGNLKESTDVKGRTTTYTYDSRHLLKSTLAPANVGAYLYTEMIRNEQGSITQMVVRKDSASGEILQKVKVNSLDTYGNVTSQSILNGAETITTTTQYDSSNHAFPVSQKIDVKNADQEFSTVEVKATFNPANGQMTSSSDGKNDHVTEYQYDVLGRVNEVIHPDLTRLSAVYDDLNNTITVTDENGAVARTQWNALGWQTESGIFEADGYKNKASISYDSFGRKEWSEDALGNKTQYRYDAWNRPIWTLYPDTTEAIEEYNDVLRTRTIIDAEGYATIQTYNKWGQAEKQEEQASPASGVRLLESYTYNSVNDQLMERTDAKGMKTRYEYDYEVNLVAVTDAKGNTTRYAYDMLGNPLTTTYPDGKVKSKTYDELGRVLTTTDESGQKEKYTYDASGNLVGTIDRNGATTTYIYDKMNRLNERISADETVSYTYDDAGKRTRMTDNTGTTSYHYDPYTALLTRVDYADGLKLQNTEYDANGNRTRTVGPFGEAITYTYDVMNRLKSLGTDKKNPETNYTYKKNGLLQQSTAGNAINSQFIYTGLDLTGLNHLNVDTLLNQYQYVYDENKNIQSRIQNSLKDNFSYDELNRVSTSTENSTEIYDYDTRGNRTSLITGLSLNALKDTEYTYDKQNHLTKVQVDGQFVEYDYNGDGLLVQRIENGVTTRYYYDGDQVIAEATVVNGVPQLVASYIRGHRLEVIAYQDGTKGYPIYNGHGDVVEIRNEQGALLNHYQYDQWGNILSKEESVHNPFRYSGELWDGTTNLQYLRARWYDPSMGRFLNEDTYEGQIDNPLSLNLYTYVLNNPMKYSDPSGHMYTEIGNAYSAGDRTALQNYQSVFLRGQQEKDLLMMQAAHDASNYIRLKYEPTVNRTNYLKNGTVYKSLTVNMYNEVLSGNAKEVPLLDDPMFYVFDGTFAAAYKALSKLAIKQLGKESVNQTTQHLIKLDLQFFAQSIQKLDDKFIKKMGIDAHDLKYEFLGKNAKISHYDLYVDKASKEIMIFKKGGKGEGIYTGYFAD